MFILLDPTIKFDMILDLYSFVFAHSAFQLKLLDEYRLSAERVKFSECWRPETGETKLEKLIRSLGKRMPWLNVRNKQDADGSEQTENNMDVDSESCETESGGNPSTSMSNNWRTDDFLLRIEGCLRAW